MGSTELPEARVTAAEVKKSLLDCIRVVGFSLLDSESEASLVFRLPDQLQSELNLS
jgi:hypothetical protein